MKHEEILLHPYYDKIKDMCYKDEPGAQIERWVKNTIDDDDSIAQEKKADYYLSDRKVNAFKKLLQEQTQDIMVGLAKPAALVPTDIQTGDVEVQLNTAAPVKSILVRDTERNVLRMSESFLNLLQATQERYMELLKSARERGFTDAQEEKNIRGYLVELRNQMEFIFKATGNEEFARVMGAARAEEQVKGVLTDAKKHRLKQWARDILAEAAPETIADKLSELEDILDV